MTVRLYAFSGAPRSRRVEVALKLKQLAFDAVFLETSDRESWEQDFLRLNPRAKVPTVECDGIVIRDSFAILAWLDAAFPERPLFGTTAPEIARAWQFIREADEYLLPAMRDVVVPAFRNAADDARVALEAAHRDASRALHAELTRMEEMLGSGPFLCSLRPGVAEAVAYPDMALVERALETRPRIMTAAGFGNITALYPRLADWSARVAAIPGIDGTVPPHWRAVA